MGTFHLPLRCRSNGGSTHFLRHCQLDGVTTWFDCLERTKGPACSQLETLVGCLARASGQNILNCIDANRFCVWGIFIKHRKWSFELHVPTTISRENQCGESGIWHLGWKQGRTTLSAQPSLLHAETTPEFVRATFGVVVPKLQTTTPNTGIGIGVLGYWLCVLTANRLPPWSEV